MPAGTSASPQLSALTGVFTSLHRAYRELRFYPTEHPTVRQSVERAVGLVRNYLDKFDVLSVEVHEEALVYEGFQVYTHAPGNNNLAFLMFRDGLRSLTFRAGVEAEEIEGLLSCLAHADDLAAQEHDLVTALWEQDFTHIDYYTADPFVADALRQGTVDAVREAVIRRLQEGEIPTCSGEVLKWDHMYTVIPKKLDAKALALSAEELESLNREVDGLSTVLQDYLVVLLEVVETAPIRTPDDRTGPAFAAVMAALLDRGDIDRAKDLIERLKGYESSRWAPEGFVGEIVGKAFKPNHLPRLFGTAGGDRNVEAAVAEEFLLSIRSWIMPLLIHVLAESQDRGTRKSVLTVLSADGGVPWAQLEPLLMDDRWYVVRNGVHLAAGGRHLGLLNHSPRLLAHPDARVRREALRALEPMGVKEALPAITSALSDRESSVRTLAARAIGRDGGIQQEELVRAHIEDRNFAELPSEEASAFLNAYAELARDRALPLLDKMWRKKVFASRPLPLRLAALEAIGRVRSQAALAILNEAAGSGERQVKAAARQVLQTPFLQTPPKDP